MEYDTSSSSLNLVLSSSTFSLVSYKIYIFKAKSFFSISNYSKADCKEIISYLKSASDF